MLTLHSCSDLFLAVAMQQTDFTDTLKKNINLGKCVYPTHAKRTWHIWPCKSSKKVFVIINVCPTSGRTGGRDTFVSIAEH